MPYKEKEITKMYHSIGEVAEMFDVNTSLIRFGKKNLIFCSRKKTKKVIVYLLKKTLKILK